MSAKSGTLFFRPEKTEKRRDFELSVRDGDRGSPFRYRCSFEYLLICLKRSGEKQEKNRISLKMKERKSRKNGLEIVKLLEKKKLLGKREPEMLLGIRPGKKPANLISL